MMEDIAALPQEVQSADVVIVGTGIAALGAALPILQSGLSVLMLESGRTAFDPAIQALNEMEQVGKTQRALDPDGDYHSYLAPHLRGTSRLRQFGGTSNLWTGKWKRMEPDQIGSRDWMPLSGWPIGWDDLLEHYRGAARDHGLGDPEPEEARAEIADLRARLSPHGLRLSTFYWERTPTRAGTRLSERIGSLQGLRIVQGATATELRRDADGAVREVLARDLSGARMTARGRVVILATGAIETARLLLVSRRADADGIGNAHGLVGRYFLDHVKAQHIPLRPGPLMHRVAAEFRYGPKPRFCLMLGLDRKTQRDERLRDHGIYLKPRYAGRAARIADRIGAAFGRRRMPTDGNGAVQEYHVKIACEQVANPDSRVRLSERTDPLGVPRTVLDWRFTEGDHASTDRIVSLARERLSASGLGEIDFGGAPPGIEQMTDAAHHMGTARMSDSPETGVTDPDCKVRGTPNLYVAGSAVFPSGPVYSPTLTILALSRRLGHHVAARHGPHG